MTFEFPEARIQIFCKAPVAGTVMTRLIPELGDEGARELHERLARRIIEVSIQSALAPVELWCAPDTDHEFFTTGANESAQLHQQAGDGLGERMLNGARHALTEEEAEAVLIIGTDCPDLDDAYLRHALQKLTDHDAVIGPAEDGGYGLIGLKQANRAFFDGIEWSSSTVCAETCRRFNEARLFYSLLPLLWDVDRPEDLRRLHL